MLIPIVLLETFIPRWNIPCWVWDQRRCIINILVASQFVHPLRTQLRHNIPRMSIRRILGVFCITSSMLRIFSQAMFLVDEGKC